ncbi:MAG: hypothetical protein KY475_20620, partial [Planctomycetes bacterium]|nr:hypothetical protein [Planctomycetota bacterium]
RPPETLEAVKSLLAQGDVDAVVRPLLEDWYKQSRGLRFELSGLGADEFSGEFGSLYDACFEKPWEEAPRERLRATVAKAVNEWMEWVDSGQAWDEIEVLKAGRHLDDEVRSLLDKWYGDVAARAGKPWTLRLRSGSAAPRYGVERLLYVETGAASFTGAVHNWTAASRHIYANGAQGGVLKVAWSPDQPIEMYLYGERSYVYRGGRRYELMHVRSSGPLAMIRLHYARVIAGKLATLVIEIEECPGPSPSLVKKVRTTGAAR